MRSVRLFFKKYGNMKFVSHLDMNRFMIRMVRMSGIPVWYSEGFNPHPYITFALPLSLGFESDYETMDIRLDKDEFENESVYNALRPLMPQGIELFDFGDPVMKAGDIVYADYKITFGVLSTEIKEALNSYLSAEVIETEKRTKKGGLKTINIKDFIKAYCFVDSDSVKFTLAAGGNNNLNPKLILDAFESKTGIKLPAYSIIRTSMYNEKMELFK
jgi:radical SAM-linked protein